MATISIIDSHIHLWPASASNSNGHAWMTPGVPLAKEHLLSDYRQALRSHNDSRRDIELRGVVYIETDRRYESPNGELASWAQGPLDEVRFVGEIVEGKYGQRDSDMLLGIVLWAPMDQSPITLREWLALAEQAAGPKTWRRVKGFRFLLQAIHNQSKFQNLVLGKDFIANLKILGARGFSFDVGVDQHSTDVWQLELICQAMQLAHDEVEEQYKTTFILNHLCKPDFSNLDNSDPKNTKFDRWKQAIENLSHCSQTYMKLSGAFSELPARPSAQDDVASQIVPWISCIFDCFGARRVLFGSDWPVCNVNGPTDGSPCLAWIDVVADSLQNLVDPVHHRLVWSEVAWAAYKL